MSKSCCGRVKVLFFRVAPVGARVGTKEANKSHIKPKWFLASFDGRLDAASFEFNKTDSVESTVSLTPYTKARTSEPDRMSLDKLLIYVKCL